MTDYAKTFMIGPRGSGRTTAIANACKLLDATMLCANHVDAARVKARHGIPAVSIHSDLSGMRGPYLADHFAMLDVCLRYEQKIKELQSRIEQLEAALRKTEEHAIAEGRIVAKCNDRIEELESALRENGKAFGMYGDHVRQAGCYAIAEDRE